MHSNTYIDTYRHYIYKRHSRGRQIEFCIFYNTSIFLDANDGTIKEVRKEYIRLVKDLKKTAKSDEYKVMNYYLKEFAKVCQKYEEIEQPKI